LINKVHGGPVISAMEVNQLDDEWVDVFIGISVDMPNMQARKKAIDNAFKAFTNDYTQRTGIKVH
jgi:hypothetical protein